MILPLQFRFSRLLNENIDSFDQLDQSWGINEFGHSTWNGDSNRSCRTVAATYPAPLSVTSLSTWILPWCAFYPFPTIQLKKKKKRKETTKLAFKCAMIVLIGIFVVWTNWNSVWTEQDDNLIIFIDLKCSDPVILNVYHAGVWTRTQKFV